MFIRTDGGRVVELSEGKELLELADGFWGPLRSPIFLGSLMDDDARELSAEEVAKLEKSGKSK